LALVIISVVSFFAISFDANLDQTSIDEDISSLLNFTINNTETTTNITQVNITLPNTNFTFDMGTNGTSASDASFSNTSTLLSWTNTTTAGIIQNETVEYFWFNVTASQPGSYNFIVTLLNSSGVSNSTNVSITINDTTPPTVGSIQPTSADEDVATNYNATVNDNVAIDSCSLYINSTLNGTMNISGTTANRTVTFATPGTYILLANCTDAAGNINDTSNTTITINDITVPVITLISPADSTSSTVTEYNFTFNVTDDENITNCSLIFDDAIIHTLTSVNNSGGTNGMYNSSLSVATHTWSINCTDASGNTGDSSTRTLVVTSGEEDDDDDSSSSGGGESSFWTQTYYTNNEQFEEGYTKELAVKHRIKMKINNVYHQLGIVELTDTLATINISSETIQIELGVDGEAKVDVVDDGYYDLYVSLLEIDDDKARVTIQKIHEAILEGEGNVWIGGEEEETSSEEEQEQQEDITKDINILWWIIPGIILIGAISYFFLIKKKK